MPLGMQYYPMNSKKIEQRTQQFDQSRVCHVVLLLLGRSPGGEVAARDAMLKAQAHLLSSNRKNRIWNES